MTFNLTSRFVTVLRVKNYRIPKKVGIRCEPHISAGTVMFWEFSNSFLVSDLLVRLDVEHVTPDGYSVFLDEYMR